MLKSLCLKYFNYPLLLGCRKSPSDVAHKTLHGGRVLSDLTLRCNSSPLSTHQSTGSHWAPFGPLCTWLPEPTMFSVPTWRPRPPQANSHSLHGLALVSASEKSFWGNSVLLPLLQSLSQLQATLLSPVISSSRPLPPAPSEAPCLQRLHTHLTEHERTWLLDITCR